MRAVSSNLTTGEVCLSLAQGVTPRDLPRRRRALAQCPCHASPNGAWLIRANGVAGPHGEICALVPHIALAPLGLLIASPEEA